MTKTWWLGIGPHRPQKNSEYNNSLNTRYPSGNRRLLVKTPAPNILLSAHCNTPANKAADGRRPVRAIAPDSKSFFSRFIARRGEEVVCNAGNAQAVLTNRTVAESEGDKRCQQTFSHRKIKGAG